MRAIRFHEYGGPEVLRYEDCEAPRARAGQVLVAIEVAGVNPVDWRVRSGQELIDRLRQLPAVPGVDFAGRIAAVGSGVRGFVPGDRVFGQCETDRMGSYAELVPVSAQRLARVPRELDMNRAASLPSIALAAWHGLFEFGELRPGLRLLIAGVAGCTGMLAAQLANLVEDVQIVGACRRDRWSEELRGLCRTLVDSDDVHAVARLRGDFDLVLNFLGEPFELAAIAATRRGGSLVTSSAVPDFARCWARSVRGVGLSGRFDREHLELVARLVAAGQLRVPDLRVEHLSAAPAVHSMAERRELRGKAVLVTM